jgi:hypothetical protein
MRATTLVTVLSLCAAAAADVTYLGVVAFPGQLTDKSGQQGEVAPGIPASILGAHGSGIAWTGKRHEYLMLADRGPMDGATPFACRWQLVRFPLEDDGLPAAAPACIGTTMLTDEQDRPFIGDARAIDPSERGSRLDPEAIRIGPDGTVYISDEYGPAVMAFGKDGKLVKRFAVPEKFLCRNPAGTRAAEMPPANTTGRVVNHGFEGLALNPAGDTLYAMLQGPLLQDGALDEMGKDAGVNVRILAIPLAGGPTREYVYQLDKPGLGVNELLAVSDHEFLVIERDDAAGEQAKFKKVMRIDLAGASDVSAVESLPGSGLPDGVKAVKKSVAIDLLNPQYGLNDDRMPAKIEGLTFGPPPTGGGRTLIITSDNDAKTDEATWMWVFSLTGEKARN